MLARADWRAGTETRSPLPAQRVVTHGERVWLVREADSSLAPDAPRTQCLILECALTMRRTWNYPREWAVLPDPELLQLFS